MTFSRPELHVDDESSVRSSIVRGTFTSGRRPLGSSSSVLKVLNIQWTQFEGKSIVTFISEELP